MHLLQNCQKMKPRSYLVRIVFQFSLASSSTISYAINPFVCVAMDEVLLVFQNQYRQLHTTRSWNFIGLPPTAKRRLKVESDIIVGVIDTGSSWLSSHFSFSSLPLYYINGAS